MAAQESLVEALAHAFPLNYELICHHISTLSTPCPAIFSPSPGQVEEQTFCQSHFLAASLPARVTSEGQLLVFAIEVLIFTTQNLTTIFVSKADSTGYLQLHKAHVGSPSIIKTICTTFLSYLVRQRLQGPRVLVSLFARSQNQYLFPGSIENTGKHVLDDRQLIKWWCRVIDPVLQEYRSPYGEAMVEEEENVQPNTTAEAFIIVPGCDPSDTRAFFPPTFRSQPKPRWSATYPSSLLVQDGSAPPRCLIPRLPDDPKARFLDDLDSEIPEGSQSNAGSWRSVKSLEQFWEMMSYRQECSAGRLVGFIWTIFTPSTETRHLSPSQSNGFQETTGRTNGAVTHLPTPKQFQTTQPDPIPPPSAPEDHPPTTSTSTTPQPSPPIPYPGDRPTHSAPSELDSKMQPTTIKATVTNSISNSNDETQTLLLPSPAYQTLLSHLLTLDFSTPSLATTSTSSWLHKASELAAAGTIPIPSSCAWSYKVTGRKAIMPPAATVATTAGQENGTHVPALPVVNVLTGLRRKKKRREGEMVGDKAGLGEEIGMGTGARMKEPGLVRKKVKSATDAA